MLQYGWTLKTNVWFHLYEIPSDCLWVWSFFGDEENVLKLDAGNCMLSEFIKNHRTAYLHSATELYPQP
jgi:hypothetical protein